MRSFALQKPVQVSYGCGLVVHNNWLSLCVIYVFLHTAVRNAYTPVEKAYFYTLPLAQLCRFLYTASTHVFWLYQSVKRQLVHILHIAYIKNGNLEKGILGI